MRIRDGRGQLHHPGGTQDLATYAVDTTVTRRRATPEELARLTSEEDRMDAAQAARAIVRDAVATAESRLRGTAAMHAAKRNTAQRSGRPTAKRVGLTPERCATAVRANRNSLSAAARELGVTVPTVRYHLRRLPAQTAIAS